MLNGSRLFAQGSHILSPIIDFFVGAIATPVLPNGLVVMLAGAIATTAGAICGTSAVTTFAESSAGIADGGRTGLAAMVTAVLFFAAMAFTVKSRRLRSSRSSGTKRTHAGRRPSRYAPSVRKVVTSYASPPRRTVTVPWRIPEGTVCANSAVTASGGAEVAMSQSCSIYIEDVI